ncbi:unnamed protein product [Calypogeia fissa]
MVAEPRVSINWTEAARLQLVEAVIKVEKEMTLNESNNRASQGGSSGQKLNSKIEKWNAITRLLPVELQAESWSTERQSYNIPKCYSMFHNLMIAYRDMVDGRGNLFNLTEPVCKLLRKREELLNGKKTVPVERRLIPGSSKRVNIANNLSSGLVAQRLSKNVANSSKGQSVSTLLPEEREAIVLERSLQLERTENAQNFDRSDHAEREHMKAHPSRGKSYGSTIHWTETDCLLVIEAVLQVEDEVRNRCITPRRMRKWERVEILLPPALRGRTWNSQRERYNKYKCERLFDSVLKAYRDTIKKGERSGRRHRLVTKRVSDLLKSLLNARSSGGEHNTSKSGSSDRFSISSANDIDKERLTETMNNTVNSDTDQELSSGWHSTQTGNEEGVSFLPGHGDTSCSESTEKAKSFDKNMVTKTHISHEKCTERNSADSPFGRPSRPSSLALRLQDQSKMSKMPSSTLGAASISGGESKDYKQVKPSARPAADHTRGEKLKPLGKGSGTPSLMRKSSALMAQNRSRHDENLRPVLDGLLKRLDLEFSHLSSWVQSQSVPMGTKLMKEITNSTRRSIKRRKLNDGPSTEHFDSVIDDHSFSRYMDFQIGATFEKLRIRFAEELKNTCAELTRELREGSDLLSKSPRSGSDVSRRRRKSI